MIPLSKPMIDQTVIDAVDEVLRSGNLAMGKVTKQFEEEWADYCGVNHALMFSSGTTALEAILLSLGIGPGDEVITVSFTFNATVSSILRVGATPVFVDVNEYDFCINPELIEQAITPRTKAIMPVHMYGLIADMTPIMEIANEYGLMIVEDAAQAHGATYDGVKAGHWGMAMYSLYATKNLTSGEGGFATTNYLTAYEDLKLIRNHGMKVRYEHEALGTNFKPTDITAAIGLAQLAKLDAYNYCRQTNAEYYTSALAENYLTPITPEGRTHAWHQYTMRFPGQRNEVAKRLGDLGISTGVYYPIPVHQQPYLKNYEWFGSDLPVTDKLALEVLSIPVRPDLTMFETLTIIGAIRDSADPIR